MEHVLVWAGDEPYVSELARVAVDPGAGELQAAGVAIGIDPVPYVLEYRLDCGPGFVTRRLAAATSGNGWSRELDLTRDERGVWAIEASATGDVHLAEPGGDAAVLHAAVDVDVARSPLFNTLPVLRTDALGEGAKAQQIVAVFVTVPGLAVLPARQRYTPHGGGRVLYEAVDSKFAAEIVFDADGFVVDYPGLARRRA